MVAGGWYNRAVTGTPEDAAARSASFGARLLGRSRSPWVMPVVAVAPVVTAALTVAVARRDYVTYADIAVIELDVRHLTDPLISLGPYSRFGWSHPGPALFYALAPLYRLTGGQAWSLLVGAAVVNALAVAFTVRTARRIGGVLLERLTALLVTFLLLSLGAAQWVDPWNPSITVLPLLAFVGAAVHVASGRTRPAAPLAAGVVAGSFLVQGHVGYAPFVVAVGATAAIARWLGRRAAAPFGRAGLGIAAAVGLLAWSLPLVDELRRWPSGNARLTLAYFRSSPGALGFGDALRFVSFETAIPPLWVAAELPIGILGLVDTRHSRIPAAVLLLAAATVAAVVRRARLPRAAGVLVAMAWVVLGVSLLAAWNVRDGLLAYVVSWAPVVSLVVWLALLWVGALLLRPRLGRRAVDGLAGASLVVVVAVAALGTVRATGVEPGDHYKSAMVRSLADAAEPRLRAGEPVLVEVEADNVGVQALWAAPALVGELERRGWDVRSADTRLPVARPGPEPANRVGVKALPEVDTPERSEGVEPTAVAEAGDRIAIYVGSAP